MEKTFIDKLAFVYIKGRKILSSRSRGKDTYYIPGGKREAGESDEQALVREVREELSVDLIPETIRQVGVFEAQAHGKPEGTIVRMTCYSGDFRGTLAPAAEVEEIVWLTSQDKEKSSPVDRIILDYFKKNKSID